MFRFVAKNWFSKIAGVTLASLVVTVSVAQASMRNLQPANDVVDGPQFVLGLLNRLSTMSLGELARTDEGKLFEVLQKSVTADATASAIFNSPQRLEIRTQLRALITRLPSANARQAQLIRIYNNLALWDVDDLTFVTKKIVSDIQSEIFPLVLMQLLPQAASPARENAVVQLRKNRSVSGLGVAYLLGLLQPAETEGILRIRFLRETGKLTAPRDLEIYRAVDRKFAELLGVGDPALTELFERYRLDPSWPGQRFLPYEIELIQNYLRRLWTLQNFKSPKIEARVASRPLSGNVVSLWPEACEKSLR